jgi:hypothetical protein
MSELGGRVGACVSSAKPIVRAQTETGRAMLLEYLPVVNENLIATSEGRVQYVSKGVRLSRASPALLPTSQPAPTAKDGARNDQYRHRGDCGRPIGIGRPH